MGPEVLLAVTAASALASAGAAAYQGIQQSEAAADAAKAEQKNLDMQRQLANIQAGREIRENRAQTEAASARAAALLSAMGQSGTAQAVSMKTDSDREGAQNEARIRTDAGNYQRGMIARGRDVRSLGQSASRNALISGGLDAAVKLGTGTVKAFESYNNLPSNKPKE